MTRNKSQSKPETSKNAQKNTYKMYTSLQQTPKPFKETLQNVEKNHTKQTPPVPSERTHLLGVFFGRGDSTQNQVFVCLHHI